ncbi:MAG: nicotinate-nucleotide adenylyltransferase [Planctomycetia bacterium]|nr:nicotinate-nucleotide adenylyltransferase [Planctomycetia bacterium]
MQPSTRPQIGIFGGSFDPVHLGHLITAEQCREQARLDQVWFVPAARPPHKLDQALTPFARRVEMLTLALAGHAAFRVEELERDRPGPSYTVDTLQELAARQPDANWHFILGADSLPELPGWREPLRILELADLLVVARPGSSDPDVDVLKAALGLTTEEVRLQVVAAPLIGLSSTDLRQRVRAGRSIRYLVPRAVECYIQEKKLYREDAR